MIAFAMVSPAAKLEFKQGANERTPVPDGPNVEIVQMTSYRSLSLLNMWVVEAEVRRQEGEKGTISQAQTFSPLWTMAASVIRRFISNSSVSVRFCLYS